MGSYTWECTHRRDDVRMRAFTHEWRERREFNKQRVEGDVGLRGSDVYESGSLRRGGRDLNLEMRALI